MAKGKWTIGVDEVGRGPLAGPVAVGVVAVPPDFSWCSLPGVNDSKKLTVQKRQFLRQATASLQRQQQLRYTVVMTTAAVIDRIGIVPAIDRALQRGLKQVIREQYDQPAISEKDCMVKLDGGLVAPEIYAQQETIVRGDGIEPVIGLASIMAKVKRDKYMQRLGTRPEYQVYGFGKHKGYGTIAHRAAIEQYGLSAQHRWSFCRRFA